MNILTRVSMLLVIVFLNNACASTSEFKISSTEGSVIDKETGLPLEGVVIVSEWPIEGGYHGSVTGYLPYQQVLTDSNGKYFIPGQGVVQVEDYIYEFAPNLYVFKSGYKTRVVSNGEGYKDNSGKFPRISTDKARIEYNKTSIWDERAIELEKFKGSNEGYLQSLIESSRYFDGRHYDKNFSKDYKSRPDCNWPGVDIPLWYEMINREIKKIKPEREISRSIQIDYNNYKECQRWDEFFKVFRK